MNVFPFHASADTANLHAVNPKNLCEGSVFDARFSLCSSEPNQFRRHFGMRKSISHRLTMFCYFVGIIISLCTKKQVGWINARRVIAFVQHMKSFRNLSVAEFVSDAMRKGRMLIDEYDSVTRLELGSFPWPAFLCRTPIYSCAISGFPVGPSLPSTFGSPCRTLSELHVGMVTIY